MRWDVSYTLYPGSVIYPPGTQYSAGRGKRSFQPWPVTDNGVDGSWNKNNKSSASWFCCIYENNLLNNLTEKNK